MACRDAATRKQWGCDRPAVPAGYAIDCYVCQAQPAAIYSCPACKGAGQMGIDRCPSKFITPEVEEFVRAYERYREGYLPVDGGLVAQSQCFIEALPWVVRMWRFYEWISSENKARASIESAKGAARGK